MVLPCICIENRAFDLSPTRGREFKHKNPSFEMHTLAPTPPLLGKRLGERFFISDGVGSFS
jgi:hypothetical protein